MEKPFEKYHKLIDDMHNHAYENGFYLNHWSNAGRIGFICTKTNTIWHMNEYIWSDSVPDVVRESYETDDGKDSFLNSLKILFASPHQETKKTCIAHGCTRGPKKGKKGFCGWCVKKFEKGMFEKDGTPIRTWKKIKEDISPRINTEKLKGFGESYPEYTKTFGCPTLNHFVDPVVCIGRQFISDKKKCKKCEMHRDKIKDLENYLDSCK